MSEKTIFERVTEQLLNADTGTKRAVLGFDGFVDNVVYVVDKRLDADHYERVPGLKDYGEKIARAAGKSLNIEMVPIQQKLGGNGPILANSLVCHGCKVTYIGALGKYSIHPVFQDMSERAEVISISDPGNTDAIEFLDGKIISSQLEPLKDVNWENLKEKVGIPRLVQLFQEADLIGFENWTLLIHMTELWHHILDEVVPLLSKDQKKKILFIDLADPEKRKQEDILEALALLEKLGQTFRVVLGLNYKEAGEIAQLCCSRRAEEYEGETPARGRLKDDGKTGRPWNTNLPTLELAEFIKQNLAVEQVVVHPVKEACVVSDKGSFSVTGPYCEKPVLTTGAGDNFNAGYVLGLLLGCSEEEALLIGTANSGFYVRNGRSAHLDELLQFVKDWNAGIY